MSGRKPTGADGAFTRARASTQAHTAARRWTLVAGAVCALAGWLIEGTGGLTGGVVGALIVVAFLSSGLVPVLIAQRTEAAGLRLAVLLLTYTLRIALAALLLALISRVDWVNDRWLGLTIIACALIWSAMHIAHAVRMSKREPTVVPDEPSQDGHPPPERGS